MSSIKIMLVDPDTAFRSHLNTYLRQFSDMEVVCQESDPRQAVIAATTLRPNLVITEVDLKCDVNGFALAGQIREILSEVRVIIFTDSNSPEHINSPGMRNVAGYRLKSDDLPLLCGGIRDINMGGVSFTKSVLESMEIYSHAGYNNYKLRKASRPRRKAIWTG